MVRCSAQEALREHAQSNRRRDQIGDRRAGKRDFARTATGHPAGYDEFHLRLEITDDRAAKGSIHFRGHGPSRFQHLVND